MADNSTTIYIPIETYNKILDLQQQLAKILHHKPKPYEIIEMLITLQLTDFSPT